MDIDLGFGQFLIAPPLNPSIAAVSGLICIKPISPRRIGQNKNA
jgi:hypothetical protein